MKRLVWLGGNEFQFEHRDGPVPTPPPGQVAVRIKAVGVCGTDIHIISGKYALAQPPLVLGHEMAGEIAGVGPGVSRVAAGDRVTIDQVVGCGTCFFCRGGSVQFCETGFELGITRDGGCQDYVVTPERNVYRIPESISYEEAAVLDMEVWGALAKCGIQKGDAVLVLGHGPAGLVAAQVARVMGAGKVMLAGRSEARLKKAESLGLADVYIRVRQQNLLETVRDATQGRGADVVFEGAGSPETVVAAVEAVIPGGKIVFYGVQTGPLSQFDINRVVVKDLAVFGALSDRRGWEDVIACVESGRLRLAPLITHRFPLECAPQAYDLVRSKADGVVKAVLTL